MGRATGRSLWIGATALACTTLLSGCSPANQNALTRINGMPAVINCGAYVDQIAVRDGDTGRLVWAAHLDQTVQTAQPVPTVQAEQPEKLWPADAVVVGVLPADNWIEDATYEPDPTPAKWEFLIEDPPQRLSALDTDIVEGTYLYEGRKLTYEQFRNDVCEEDGGPLMDFFNALVILGIVLAAGAIVTVVVWYIVRGRHGPRRRPGWYLLDGNWRWWNGSTWQ